MSQLLLEFKKNFVVSAIKILVAVFIGYIFGVLTAPYARNLVAKFYSDIF